MAPVVRTADWAAEHDGTPSASTEADASAEVDAEAKVEVEVDAEVDAVTLLLSSRSLSSSLSSAKVCTAEPTVPPEAAQTLSASASTAVGRTVVSLSSASERSLPLLSAPSRPEASWKRCALSRRERRRKDGKFVVNVVTSQAEAVSAKVEAAVLSCGTDDGERERRQTRGLGVGGGGGRVGGRPETPLTVAVVTGTTTVDLAAALDLARLGVSSATVVVVVVADADDRCSTF